MGNADKEQPIGYHEKSMISFEVENVDDSYQKLLSKGIEFVNQPTDMPDWGMRMVHFRDPEENLTELYAPLQAK